MYIRDGLSCDCHIGVVFKAILKKQESIEPPVQVGLCLAWQGTCSEEPTGLSQCLQIPSERLEIGGADLGIREMTKPPSYCICSQSQERACGVGPQTGFATETFSQLRGCFES